MHTAEMSCGRDQPRAGLEELGMKMDGRIAWHDEKRERRPPSGMGPLQYRQEPGLAA